MMDNWWSQGQSETIALIGWFQLCEQNGSRGRNISQWETSNLNNWNVFLSLAEKSSRKSKMYT